MFSVKFTVDAVTLVNVTNINQHFACRRVLSCLCGLAVFDSTRADTVGAVIRVPPHTSDAVISDAAPDVTFAVMTNSSPLI